VAEVLAWLLVGPVYPLQAGLLAWLWGSVYLSRADLSAWEYPLRMERAVLAYPSAVGWMALAYLWLVEQVRQEYRLRQAFLFSSVRALPGL